MAEFSESIMTESFLADYEIGRKIGEADNGSIHVAVRKSDGLRVAMKFVPKEKYLMKFKAANEYGYVTSEVAAYEVLQQHGPPCPNIVEFYEYFMNSEQTIIVSECPTPYMTLHTFIQKKGGRLSEDVARKLLRQFVSAAQHLVNHGVVTIDIHDKNILVDPKTLQLKLTNLCTMFLLLISPFEDFDEATSLYLPVHKGLFALSETVSCYANDVPRLLTTMVNGFNLYSRRSRVRFQPSVSKECRSLLLLNTIGEMSLEEILEHEFFKQGE